jgi:MFS family permease
MRQYLEILRTPRVARLFGASLLARLPIGINGLALVLLVEAETGSFGSAGAVSGALALGTGAAAPLAGRVIDALGERLLMVLACVHAAALVAIVALTRAGAPTIALVATALVAGAALPPASSVLRARFPALFGGRPALIQGSFALDSVLTETIFTVAPLLTAALVVLVDPAAAVVVGNVILVATVPPLARSDEAPEPGWLGALASPGIRTLVVAMFPVGFAFGALEVALPAFADDEGSPELAGVLLALWSVGSLIGGLVYGARPRRRPLARVHLLIALGLPLTLAPLAVASSPFAMALLVLPAGTLIAPLIATRNELAGRVAPVGSETEAYTWPLTAMVAGIAAGAAAAGALSDAASWQAAVLVAAAAAAVGAAVATGRRATLAPATACA